MLRVFVSIIVELTDKQKKILLILKSSSNNTPANSSSNAFFFVVVSNKSLTLCVSFIFHWTSFFVFARFELVPMKMFQFDF